MPRTSYHVTLTAASAAAKLAPPYQDVYPVTLLNGACLNLPIQPLPGGEEAIALLMSNQTPFEVEHELASLMSKLAAEFAAEVIAGVPTLGLDYARLVARDLGLPTYVALGNSRKFWYSDELSVPVHSVTSPGAEKKLYLDPMLVERVAGKRTLLIDDVINTGGSAAAAIALLQHAGASVIGLCVVLIEGLAWTRALAALAPDWPGRVRGLGTIPLFTRTPQGWVPQGWTPEPITGAG
jgi:adenine/guanine phosphoribosyltransferase-like PRPP-binding protein